MTPWKQTFLLGSKSLNDSPSPAERKGKAWSFAGPSDLHGAVSATPPPATRSLGPAPRLGPPLTSPLPRPRTPGSLPPLPLSAGGAPSAQNTVPQTPARLTPSAPSGPCAKGIFSVRMSPVISGSIASLCVSISNVLHDGPRCYVNNKPERLFSLPVYPQEQRETSGTCSVLIY